MHNGNDKPNEDLVKFFGGLIAELDAQCKAECQLRHEQLATMTDNIIVLEAFVKRIEELEIKTATLKEKIAKNTEQYKTLLEQEQWLNREKSALINSLKDEKIRQEKIDSEVKKLREKQREYRDLRNEIQYKKDVIEDKTATLASEEAQEIARSVAIGEARLAFQADIDAKKEELKRLKTEYDAEKKKDNAYAHEIRCLESTVTNKNSDRTKTSQNIEKYEEELTKIESYINVGTKSKEENSESIHHDTKSLNSDLEELEQLKSVQDVVTIRSRCKALTVPGELERRVSNSETCEALKTEMIDGFKRIAPRRRRRISPPDAISEKMLDEGKVNISSDMASNPNLAETIVEYDIKEMTVTGSNQEENGLGALFRKLFQHPAGGCLHTLKLQNLHWTDAQLIELANSLDARKSFLRLKIFVFKKNQGITLEGFKALAKIIQLTIITLQELELSDLSITDEHFEAMLNIFGISPSPALTKLVMKENSISLTIFPQNKRIIDIFPNLSSVDFSKNKLDMVELEQLLLLSEKLEELRLNECSLGADAIYKLSERLSQNSDTKITLLSLEANVTRIANATDIPNMCNAIVNFMKITSLNNLWMRGNYLDDEAFAKIASYMPEQIKIKSFNIGPYLERQTLNNGLGLIKLFEELATRAKELSVLSLSHIIINENPDKFISNLARTLSRFSQINCISLVGVLQSPQMVESFFKNISGDLAQRLVHLNIGVTTFSENPAENISFLNAIVKMKNLSRFLIYACNLQETLAIKIFKALSSCTKIKAVSIYDNDKITTEGFLKELVHIVFQGGGIAPFVLHAIQHENTEDYLWTPKKIDFKAFNEFSWPLSCFYEGNLNLKGLYFNMDKFSKLIEEIKRQGKKIEKIDLTSTQLIPETFSQFVAFLMNETGLEFSIFSNLHYINLNHNIDLTGKSSICSLARLLCNFRAIVGLGLVGTGLCNTHELNELIKELNGRKVECPLGVDPYFEHGDGDVAPDTMMKLKDLVTGSDAMNSGRESISGNQNMFLSPNSRGVARPASFIPSSSSSSSAISSYRKT